MNRSFSKVHWKFVILGLFGIAMGDLEAIVVVYLREIYYPHGFDFPLTLLSQQMFSVECLRESATIVMLVAIGILAGKDNLQRLAYFLYTFAIWDISYYIWLKLLLNWPSSLLTWDVLLLIPVPWIGPVLAPLISSLTMILWGGMIIVLQEKRYIVKIKLFEWGLTFLGAFMILGTFVWDYSKIIIHECVVTSFETLGNTGHIFDLISSYKPTYYNWYLFVLGEFFILCALVLMYIRTRGGVKDNPKGIRSSHDSGNP